MPSLFVMRSAATAPVVPVGYQMSGNNSTGVVASTPSHAVGDLLIAVVNSMSTTPLVAGETGWTELYRSAVYSGFGPQNMVVFYKFATYVSSSYSFNHYPAIAPLSVIMASYRDAATPVLPSFSHLTNTQTLTAPSITPGGSGILVGTWTTTTGNNRNPPYTPPLLRFDLPAGMTKQREFVTRWYDAQAYGDQRVTAGATGTKTTTYVPTPTSPASSPSNAECGLFFIPDAA